MKRCQKHPNILKIVTEGEDFYKELDMAPRLVPYIVLEHAAHGDLFDVVNYSGPFSEELTRYFFKQFLEALKHIPQNGLAHRDIKIENVLLDQNCELKINDFGYACSIVGPNGNGILD